MSNICNLAPQSHNIMVTSRSLSPPPDSTGSDKAVSFIDLLPLTRAVRVTDVEPNLQQTLWKLFLDTVRGPNSIVIARLVVWKHREEPDQCAIYRSSPTKSQRPWNCTSGGMSAAVGSVVTVVSSADDWRPMGQCFEAIVWVMNLTDTIICLPLAPVRELFCFAESKFCFRSTDSIEPSSPFWIKKRNVLCGSQPCLVMTRWSVFFSKKWRVSHLWRHW